MIRSVDARAPDGSPSPASEGRIAEASPVPAGSPHEAGADAGVSLSRLAELLALQGDAAEKTGEACGRLHEQISSLRDQLATFRSLIPRGEPDVPPPPPRAAIEPDRAAAARSPAPVPDLQVTPPATQPAAAPLRRAACWSGFQFVKVAPFRPARGLITSAAGHLLALALAAWVDAAAPPPGPSLARYAVVKLAVHARPGPALTPSAARDRAGQGDSEPSGDEPHEPPGLVESSAGPPAEQPLPGSAAGAGPERPSPGLLIGPAPPLGPFPAGDAALGEILRSLGAIAPIRPWRDDQVALLPRPRSDHGIILSSPSNLIPESAGVLRGSPHYGIHVAVDGAPRKWLLEYVSKSLLGGRLEFSENAPVVRVLSRPPLDPPFPAHKEPLRLSARADAAVRNGASRMVVFFSLDESGTMHDLRVLVSAGEQVDREVLGNLSAWEFVPAFEGQSPAAANIVLVVALQ